MSIKRCFISLLILLAAAPWPALAQQEICRDIIPSTAAGGRVVTECRRTTSEAGGVTSEVLPAREMETRVIEILGYWPGDGEKHIYVLTLFMDTRVGNTNLYPDDQGVAQVTLPSMQRPGAPEQETAILISSVNVETDEVLYSVEMRDVLVRSFLNALFNARMNLDGDLASLRGQVRPRLSSRGGRPSPNNGAVLGDRRATLTGENLSLEETLDLLYQASGCSVFLEEDYLVAKSCR